MLVLSRLSPARDAVREVLTQVGKAGGLGAAAPLTAVPRMVARAHRSPRTLSHPWPTPIRLLGME